MTLPHFSFSAARNFPNSAGEVAKTFSPQSLMVCLILGPARPALIALLSVSLIGAGVVLGATTPIQPSDSQPGTNSAMVGTSGNAGMPYCAGDRKRAQSARFDVL